jgi:transcriptional regulator GlxA family with amidase domain
MTPKHIAIVGYNDITSLDLSGPLEAFTSAVMEDSKRNRRPCYKVTIAGLDKRTFRSESGLQMTATCSLSSLRHVDTLIIPGGQGMRLSASAPKLVDWLSRRSGAIRRIATVCTGVFGLAPTG